MTSSVVPRQLVSSPPAPVPHRFGLFSSSTLLEGVPPHELNGVQYETVCSTQVDPYPVGLCPADIPSEQRQKKPADTISTAEASPFAVYAADSCVLGRDEAEARQQLRQRFLAGEQAAVERTVFDGQMGNTPYLRNAEVINTTAADKPSLIEAIGLIEQWLAENYGGVGVVHAPRTMAPTLKSQTVMDIKGGQASTVAGSAWVFGTGYPGTAPESVTAADEGTLWLYATPPVNVRRSQVIEPAGWESGAFDKATNSGLLLEERQYVVDWPCFTIALETSVTRPGWIKPPATSGNERHTTSHIKEES